MTSTHLGNHGQPEEEHSNARHREEDLAPLASAQLFRKHVNDGRAERLHAHKLKKKTHQKAQNTTAPWIVNIV